MKKISQCIVSMANTIKEELAATWGQIKDPSSTNAIVVFGVTITLGLVAGVVVGLIVVGLLAYGVYKLVQLINGSGTTATPSVFNVIHDDAVIADSNGKTITATLKRKIDGNPLPSVDIKFEIVEGPITPGITSAIAGQTSATVATDAFGKASVTIIGTAQGHDVCKVSLALGGKEFEVPYETAPPP